LDCSLLLREVGLAYQRGEAVARDDDEAARWWRRAAELGHPHAQRALADAHDEGRGVPRDAAQAAHWRARASRSA